MWEGAKDMKLRMLKSERGTPGGRWWAVSKQVDKK